MGCRFRPIGIRDRCYGGFRGNQHKAQLFTKVLQILGKVAFAIKRYFRTQGTLYLSPATNLLQALIYRFFNAENAAPVVTAQFGVVWQRRQASYQVS